MSLKDLIDLLSPAPEYKINTKAFAWSGATGRVYLNDGETLTLEVPGTGQHLASVEHKGPGAWYEYGSDWIRKVP